MRIILAVMIFVSLAGWVWVDAAASGALNTPIKLKIEVAQ